MTVWKSIQGLDFCSDASEERMSGRYSIDLSGIKAANAALGAIPLLDEASERLSESDSEGASESESASSSGGLVTVVKQTSSARTFRNVSPWSKTTVLGGGGIVTYIGNGSLILNTVRGNSTSTCAGLSRIAL